MRMIAAVLLYTLSTLAVASETARIDGKIVSTGMSAAEVRQRAGEPLAREDVQNKYGATIGQRWEYMEGRRTINLYFQQGKLVRIEQL